MVKPDQEFFVASCTIKDATAGQDFHPPTAVNAFHCLVSAFRAILGVFDHTSDMAQHIVRIKQQFFY